MMLRRRLTDLRRDRRGATLAELALTLPIWLILVFGVFNVGRFYWARAGLLNGLGEAARTATLFPVRDEAAIRAAFNDRVFGLTATEAPVVTVTPGTAGGQNFVDLEVTYDPQFFLIGVTIAPITLTYTRRAFRPA
ncbi:TadE/TadG family type IV pilus assembly protein [Sandarakinorhabdus sp.]|uniref:TadE/TadG family type IV pilus assembly protein n=1 Tax=Sandarakinorhabdus sp. TaxID=1916663 RepID=UPI003F714B94